MRWIEKLKRKIMGTNQDDVYYHESGHTVIAKLYDDVLTVEFVTANKNYSSQFDGESLGGLHGPPIRKGLSVKEANKVILIMLAGLCADLVNNYNGRVPAEFFTEKHIVNRLNQHQYSGDANYIGTVFQLYIKPHLSIRLESYLVPLMRFLYKLMLINEIWDMINIVRNELERAHNQTLTIEQLERLYAEHGFAEWLNGHSYLIEAQDRL